MPRAILQQSNELDAVMNGFRVPITDPIKLIWQWYDENADEDYNTEKLCDVMERMVKLFYGNRPFTLSMFFQHATNLRLENFEIEDFFQKIMQFLCDRKAVYVIRANESAYEYASFYFRQ